MKLRLSCFVELQESLCCRRSNEFSILFDFVCHSGVDVDFLKQFVEMLPQKVLSSIVEPTKLGKKLSSLAGGNQALRLYLCWLENFPDFYLLEKEPTMLISYTLKEREVVGDREVESIKNAVKGMPIDVHEEKDLSRIGLLKRIEELSRFDPSAFILVVMAHGYSGCVQMDDDIIPIKDILECMRKHLQNKPKVTLNLERCLTTKKL